MKAKTERLFKDVDFLTSITPSRDYLNPASLKIALEYIRAEFQKTGEKTETQNWLAAGRECENVIVSYNPAASKRLVVGAHYDVCGDQPGADDNASGVAGLMELARFVFQQKPSLNYRIDFVAYSLEEPPFFGAESMGSYVHARSLKDANADVVGMICLEMIGYFSDKPESQNFPSPELATRYPHTANFIIVVGIEKFGVFLQKVHKLMSANSGIDVQVINFPTAEGLAGLSDHRNYWKMGYNALMINDTSFIRNPNYHLKSDRIDTLDFKKMTEVVNSCYKAMIGLG